MKLSKILIILSLIYGFVHGSSRDRRATPTGQIVTASVRSKVTLTCDVDQVDYDLVQWRRNDTTNEIFVQYKNHVPSVDGRYQGRVALRNKKDLEIANLNVGDDNVYFCKVVSSKSGGVSSNSAPVRLIVLDNSQSVEPGKPKLDPPRCDGPKQKFIAKVVGSTVLIPCQVRGNPPPKIEWTQNGKKVKEGRLTTTTKGLTIKWLERSDSGSYQVTLSSIAGTFAHVTELIVKTSASVLPGHYIDAIESQMQTIPCGQSQASKDSKVTWTKRDGSVATNNPRFTLDTATGGLIVNRALRNDTGSYNCSIMRIQDGEFKVTTYEMFFNVQYHPEIIYFYPEVSALVGDSIYLPCVAVGNPAANISWEYNGQPVSKFPRYEVGPNGSLILEDVKEQDKGVYTCTPFNKWYGKKREARLVVLVPPEFKRSTPFIQLVPLGANATFDCAASGAPKPNITWPPVWSSWPIGRVYTTKSGVRTIVDARMSDYGRYRCLVVSTAGIISRDFMVFLIATPYKPVNITTEVYGSVTTLSWTPVSYGVLVQEFELWHRLVRGSDYDWEYFTFRQFGNETANITNFFGRKDILFRIRGQNKQGLGPFSDAYVLLRNGTCFKAMEDPLMAKTPLAPKDVQVNVTRSGYLFTWKKFVSPGRPPPQYFVIEVTDGNRSWTAIKVSKSVNQYFLPARNFSSDLYKFAMYAMGARKSEVVEPKVHKLAVVSEKPTIASEPVNSPRKKEDALPVIILGAMLALIVLILILSLVCFLRATGRLGGNRSRRNQDGESGHYVFREMPSGELLDGKDDDSTLLRNGNETIGTGNGVSTVRNKAFFKKQAKKAKPFHFDNCPIRLISEFDDSDHEKLLQEESAHVIFSQSPEKCECEYRRCMTLPRKPGTRPQKAPKAHLYKSASLPNGMTADSNGVNVTTDTIVNDDDYDSEDEDDFVDSKVPTIDRKFSKMKKSKMIDSYDQFCRSPSDFGSKDILSLPKERQVKGTDTVLFISENDDNSKIRLISPTEADQENGEGSGSPTESSRSKSQEDIAKSINKDAQSESGSPPHGSKENVFEDPNDASSENSATESDRRPQGGQTTVSKLRHPSAKPGYTIRSTPSEEKDRVMLGDRALTVIKETSPGTSNDSVEKHSLRSLDIRSSGFESEGKPMSTSDTESLHLSLPPSSVHKPRDFDMMSDISTRSSPGPIRRAMTNGPYDEHYEWDLPKHRTYGRPLYHSPRKERYDDRKNSMDNRDLFQSIMRMQKELGVELDDSWDNMSEDTNLSLVCNTQTPLYRDGYTSDVPTSFTDKFSSINDRDKSRRCAELLQEFKRSQPNSNSTLPRTNPVKRSQSAVVDYLRKKPLVTPKRCNSVCEEETTVFHEWLV